MNSIDHAGLKFILEAALMSASEPLSINRLQALFNEDEKPDKEAIRKALTDLADDFTERSFELVEVASGYRIQVRTTYAPWVTRLWEEKPGRYTRALLETLALIAYRQPLTRSEIAEIRGVGDNATVIKTLQERGWIKIIGHRELPGRPALYGTTREFLDYFNLRTLSDLPPLAEPRELATINAELGDTNSESHQAVPASTHSSERNESEYEETDLESSPASTVQN